MNDFIAMSVFKNLKDYFMNLYRNISFQRDITYIVMNEKPYFIILINVSFSFLIRLAWLVTCNVILAMAEGGRGFALVKGGST